MIYAGVDIGGTNIKIGLVDGEGNIIADNSIKTNAGRPHSEKLDDIVADIRRLCPGAKVGKGLAIHGTAVFREERALEAWIKGGN